MIESTRVRNVGFTEQHGVGSYDKAQQQQDGTLNSSSTADNITGGGDSTTGSLQSSMMMDYEEQYLLGDHDEVTLLCELIGARNLRVQNEDQLMRGVESNALRPYCVVKFDGKRIHRTKPAEYTGCNPIWVPSTKSLFLIRTTAKEMTHSTLNIAIHSREESALPVSLLQSSTCFLGQVNLESSMILSHCDDNRFEVNIEDEIGEEARNLGRLALRFRIATPSDLTILNHFNDTFRSSIDESQRELVDIVFDSTLPTSPNNSSIFQKTASRPIAPLVTEKDESQIAQTGFVNAMSSVFSGRTLRDRETGIRKVRVKPGPDPDRKKETQYLSPRDLKVETRLPSKKWIKAGSGTLGKLYGTLRRAMTSHY
jgi:hypothetical protein